MVTLFAMMTFFTAAAAAYAAQTALYPPHRITDWAYCRKSGSGEIDHRGRIRYPQVFEILVAYVHIAASFAKLWSEAAPSQPGYRRGVVPFHYVV